MEKVPDDEDEEGKIESPLVNSGFDEAEPIVAF